MRLKHLAALAPASALPAWAAPVGGCILALVSLFAFAADDPFKRCEEHLRFGVPHYKKADHDTTPLCRLGYVLSHNNERKVPDWVSWRLKKERAAACATRTNPYGADPDLPGRKRAELTDYGKQGYDLGQLAPGADFNWSDEAHRQSFYLSNMAPQIPPFTAGIWKTLEELARYWATVRGEIYIMAGPIFDDKPKRTVGDSQVGVPSHFYKILYDPKAGEALAFIFPHGQIRNSQNVPFFQVTVRDVERQTGLDFLVALRNRTEDTVETTTPAMWERDGMSAWRKAQRAKCGKE